jgi:hypothetical protein
MKWPYPTKEWGWGWILVGLVPFAYALITNSPAYVFLSLLYLLLGTLGYPALMRMWNARRKA